MMTSRIECVREDEVLMMVSTDRWPDAAPRSFESTRINARCVASSGLAAGA
jgi:hypothetical protein